MTELRDSYCCIGARGMRCRPASRLIVAAAILVTGATTRAEIFNIADSDEAGLIQAINDANANAEADEINLAPGSIYTLTVVDNSTDGDNGLPSITTEITINGNGAIVRRTAAGFPQMRIFHVSVGGNLTLNDVSLRNGRAIDGGNSAAERAGGAIYNAGTTTIVGCSILQNRSGGGSGSGGSPDGTPGGTGGGVHNAGTMSIDRSTIRENLTGNGEFDDFGLSGGDGGDGGGIYNEGILSITQSTIAENTTGIGGGSFQFDGSPGRGGGIYNAGDLTSIAGTISGNGAGTDAGGVHNVAQTVMTSCTIANNVGYGAYNSADLDITNTLLANQASGEDCDGGVAPFSLDHNMDSDGTCMLSGPNDISNGNAMLGPLADNGGPTETHLLLPSSDAIDAGGPDASATDQRGVPRPQDGDGDTASVSDIGAVEVIDCDGDMMDDGSATDSDGDTVPDLCDICPGEDDLLDSDGDGVADCLDPCPNSDADDSDGDGVCDSDDLCQGGDDADDADGDGVPDECDGCPDDPDKPASAVCGCGVPDVDADGNGVIDCLESEPEPEPEPQPMPPASQPAASNECGAGLFAMLPVCVIGFVATRRYTRARLTD